MAEQLHVVFDTASGLWDVTMESGVVVTRGLPMQYVAMDRACRRLGEGDGGRVHVHGADGRVRRRITVPGERGDGLGAADILPAASAATAIVAGEPPDDESADSLEKTLQVGPDTASRRAVTAANTWLIDILVIGAGLVGPPVGYSLNPAGLQGGVVAIFLSTLSISIGSFVGFLLLARGEDAMQTQFGGVTVLAGIAAGFLVGNVLAAMTGQPVTLDTDGDLAPTLDNATRAGPWWGRLGAAAFTIVSFAITGGFEVFGPVGLMLAIGCGVLVGWRAHDLSKWFG